MALVSTLDEIMEAEERRRNRQMRGYMNGLFNWLETASEEEIDAARDLSWTNGIGRWVETHEETRKR